jgi:hybrid polyketide synthase/nonribosomal peptide synthetase ACE1
MLANLLQVVIASNVLHATAKLENTLRNVRSLLKAGGYLLLLEITETRQLRSAFMVGGLSGWWLGADEGRIYSPCLTPSKWNLILRKAGFSGVRLLQENEKSNTIDSVTLISRSIR